MKPEKMTTFDDNGWELGPTVMPKAELLTALSAKEINGKRRMWRLPIIVDLDVNGLQSERLAYIASNPSMNESDRIRIRLEDSALGVSLSDRIRQYCPPGTTCRLWVAGYWGSDMHATLGNEGEKLPEVPYPFSLRSVIGPQGDVLTSNAIATVKYRDR